MGKTFEEDQGPHRAVEPVMMKMRFKFQESLLSNMLTLGLLQISLAAKAQRKGHLLRENEMCVESIKQ
jgi:hypothetical protein